MKRQHLKNLKKSANKLVKNKKINKMMNKILIDFNIELLTNFLMRNMFLSIYLVYCRNFVTVFFFVFE